MKALKDTLKKTMWESVEEPHRDLDCGLGAHPQTNQHRPHGDPEPVPRNMPAPHNEPVGCAEPVHDEPKPNEEPIANGSPHGKPAHPERTSNQDPNRPDRGPAHEPHPEPHPGPAHEPNPGPHAHPGPGIHGNHPVPRPHRSRVLLDEDALAEKLSVIGAAHLAEEIAFKAPAEVKLMFARVCDVPATIHGAAEKRRPAVGWGNALLTPDAMGYLAKALNVDPEAVRAELEGAPSHMTALVLALYGYHADAPAVSEGE